MKTELDKRVSELIDRLMVNDKITALEYEFVPEEPKEAISELARIGQPAVASLIALLKNTAKYSCLYAIKVLGEIKDPAAAKPILDAFSSQDFIDSFTLAEEYNQAVLALHSIGVPALEPTLTFLKEKSEQNDDVGILQAMEILTGIKDEKSFRALVNLLSNDAAEKEEVIHSLEEYGDKRAVEYLKKILTDDGNREDALEVIRKWVSIQEYRSIVAPYASKDVERFANNIGKDLNELKWAHESTAKFEGDNADEFNFVTLEYKIQEAVDNILREVLDLGSYEAIYSDTLKNELDDKFCEIRRSRQDFEHEHKEEIEIAIKKCYPEDVKSQLTKSYKGLVLSRYESGPKIEELLNRIREWLKAQGFSTTSHYGNLWTRKGARGFRLGCFVSAGSDYDRPRTWGTVHFGIWGNGWNEKEVEAFSTSFWGFSEGVILELVGKKRFESQTIKDEQLAEP